MIKWNWKVLEKIEEPFSFFFAFGSSAPNFVLPLAPRSKISRGVEKQSRSMGAKL